MNRLRQLPRQLIVRAPLGVIYLIALAALSGCSGGGCNRTTAQPGPDTGTSSFDTGSNVGDDVVSTDDTGTTTDAEADAPDDDATQTGDDEMTAAGLVLRVSEADGGVVPAEGAEVTATIDKNGDGVVTPEESCTTLADAGGRFEVTCPTEPGRRVVLSFREAGSAEVFRAFEAFPGTRTEWHITLRELDGLVCDNGSCALPSGDLTIKDAPEGLIGQGRVFTTLVDPRTLPGDSVDRSGNVLLTGVISTVEWIDAEGTKVTDLPQPVSTRLRLPRETWGRAEDVVPDNGQIDVPIYIFDRDNGRWVRQGQGALVDAAEAIIDEADLSTLRAGELDREVFVLGQMERAGYWSVQWPIETRGCMQGVLANDEGPLAGAVLRVLGLTHDSRSAPAVTDQSGSFCVEALRSEMEGEDLDRDGVPGETHQVTLQATIDGDVFDLGAYDVLSAESACGEGACLSLGQLDVGPEQVLVPDVCTVAGQVTDRFGQPVQGVRISAWSQANLSDEAWAELCGARLEDCNPVTETNDNGLFVMVTPRVGDLTMLATITEELATRSRRLWGGLVLQECPGNMTVELELDQGYEVIIFDVSVDESTINWSPSVPVVQIEVTDSGGDLKWSIRAGAGIESGIEYGSVPAEAEVLFPADESDPEPLASGDVISISTNITPDDAYTIIGEGEVTVE